MTSPLISVVDDDESIRDSTKALLRSVGYEVAVFESSEQFLESGRLSETGCLILDIQMPGMNGLELQDRLNISQALVPIVFVAALADSKNRQLAISRGACDFLQKPVAASDFLWAIEKAFEKSTKRLENWVFPMPSRPRPMNIRTNLGVIRWRSRFGRRPRR